MLNDFRIGQTTGYQKVLTAILVACCFSLILFQDSNYLIKFSGILCVLGLIFDNGKAWQGALLISFAGIIVLALGIVFRISLFLF